MSGESLDAVERARCASVAHWLSAAVALEWLALAATALALWRLLGERGDGAAPWLAWAALALAVPERVYALRLRFDRGLFADLAQGRIASLSALDAGLAPLRTAAPGPVRTLDARIAGTLRVWRRHAAVVAVQALLFLLAVLPIG